MDLRDIQMEKRYTICRVKHTWRDVLKYAEKKQKISNTFIWLCTR